MALTDSKGYAPLTTWLWIHWSHHTWKLLTWEWCPGLLNAQWDASWEIIPSEDGVSSSKMNHAISALGSVGGDVLVPRGTMSIAGTVGVQQTWNYGWHLAHQVSFAKRSTKEKEGRERENWRREKKKSLPVLSSVVQSLRLCLPMWGHRFDPWSEKEDSAGHGDAVLN